ncbi:MAG: DNA gyrase inhibitor YacG [Methylobacillus sp.]|jgi:endogenous inhibitor of DNA gyrase (YacG/DUF329 family)|nr:DNA gyrase inhibitor YacG [Methylobacillus sp.]
MATVTCPTCGAQSQYSPQNPHRPFCSERCKMIDLGAWANERYRVPDNDNNDLTEITNPLEDKQ